MRSISIVSAIITLSAVISASMLAQQANTFQRFELTGTLGYTYDNEIPTTLLYYPPNFNYYAHKHIINLQPGIGYYLSNEWEVQLSLNYYSILTFHSIYNSSVSNDQYELRTWYHAFGVGIGPIYNYHLNESTILFAKFAGSVSWFTSGSGSSSQSQEIPWSRPSFAFPIIAVGSKLFLSPDWMLMTFGQYSRISNFSGLNNSALQQITVGVGFAVLL